MLNTGASTTSNATTAVPEPTPEHTYAAVLVIVVPYSAKSGTRVAGVRTSNMCPEGIVTVTLRSAPIKLSGKLSVTCTSLAVAGPAFTTMIVYWISPPGAGG